MANGTHLGWNIRPDERNQDRKKIRRQVDAFLDGVASNTSNFAPLKIDSAVKNLQELGAVNAAQLTQPNPFVTGAYSAVLPMEFAIADRNGDRLQFQLLINPTSMNHGKTSTVTNSYTRDGYITQVWGTNQGLITSNGTTAAFMIEGGGLTNTARRRSLAYGNFLSFLFTYRNNGYQFIDPTNLKQQLTRVIGLINGVEMYYDNQTFMGHFNNFTIDENAERPFLFDYNFEFVVSSLSDVYNEVRGHFERIPVKEKEEIPVKTLKDLKNKSMKEFFTLNLDQEEE